MDKFVKKKPGVKKKKLAPVSVSSNLVKTEDFRHELWIEKYRPEKLEDIVGNEMNIKIIKSWFKDFQAKKKGTKRALLLGGPPGLGKTSLAHVILSEYGYQVKEYNASDVRSKKLVQANLYKLINIGAVDKDFSDEYKPVGIIMDEVDGMSSGDKGGMAELIHFINPNRGKRSVKKEDRDLAENRWIPPIICICNNRFDKKILNLKKDCLEIVFHKPSNIDLIKVIDRISKKEGFKIKDSSKTLVAKYSQGDYRRLIFLLQSLYLLHKANLESKDPKKAAKNIIDDNDVKMQYGLFCQKELELSLYETIDKLLNKNLGAEETLTIYQTDKSLLPMMIHENYVHFISQQSAPSVFVQLEEIQNCIDSVIQGDIIDKTMYNNQSWYLQPIHGLNSCYVPSYYINRYPKGEYLKSKFTTALGKFSLHCSNRKNINNLISIVSGSSSYSVPDIRVLSEIVLQKAFIKETLDHKTCVDLLKNYNLFVDDLEKLIKVNKLSTKFKGLSSVGRVKTALKKIYGVDEPFYKVKKSLNASLSSINATNKISGMIGSGDLEKTLKKKPSSKQKILPKQKKLKSNLNKKKASATQKRGPVIKSLTSESSYSSEKIIKPKIKLERIQKKNETDLSQSTKEAISPTKKKITIIKKKV